MDTETQPHDEAIKRFRASLHNTAESVADTTSKAADAFNEKSNQIKSAEQRLMEHTRKYVQENPVTSLGLAIGGGFILSRLLNCR